MAASAGARVLADSVGPGGTAALVVLALILAVVAIVLAMLGSLKRLRRNTSNGTFNTHDHRGGQARNSEQITPDSGSGGAGA